MHAILLLCGGLASDDGWLKASALDTIRRREANVDKMERHRPPNDEAVVGTSLALNWRVMALISSVDCFGPTITG